MINQAFLKLYGFRLGAFSIALEYYMYRLCSHKAGITQSIKSQSVHE